MLLTRGKDRALLARLAALGIEAAEVALLEQVDLPARALLSEKLKEGWDYVAVTSKEGRGASSLPGRRRAAPS